MTRKELQLTPPEELRKKAEELEKNTNQTLKDPATLSPAEIQSTLHELRVHQIQLEMQNEELRRIQEDLDISRERYFDLYDLAPVGYCMLNESGMIIESNLTLITLLGMHKRLFVKKQFSRFIPSDDQDLYYQFFKRLKTTKDFQECELRMLRADKSTFWVHITATALEENEEPLAYRVVLVDITESKLAEEALLVERERLEHILNITGTGIDIVDGDFNLHFVDKGWQKIYGDPVGRKCYEYFNGLEAPCPSCGISRALETKQVIVTEEVLPRENHKIVEVHIIPFQDAHGKWLVAEFNVDITERKLAEKEILKLNEELEQKIAEKTKELKERVSELERFHDATVQRENCGMKSNN